MSQPNRFQKIVADAKTRIRQITPEDAERAKASGALLIDVREPQDFAAGHISGAMSLNRGIVELEIEDLAPDLTTPILCYCGGGSRAALVAESLQRMGYANVHSIEGGFKAWKAAGLPTE
ncbi:MAG TPA: rhodanese-like domain-containing protein [Chthoniobacteraceae bacterium]|jgi:rhodanese-related sulfurtransferase